MTVLVSVDSRHVGRELEAIIQDDLVLYPTLSMRAGGSPPVIVGDGIAIFHDDEWVPAMAREFAELRGMEEPIDLEVTEDLLDTLPIRRLGSTGGPNANRPR